MVNPLIIAHLPDPVGTFNSSELPPPEENKIKKFFMELYRRNATRLGFTTSTH